MANNNLQEIKLGAPSSIEGGASPNAVLSVQSMMRCENLVLHDEDSKCTKEGALKGAALLQYQRSGLKRQENPRLFDLLERLGVRHADDDTMTAEEIFNARIGTFTTDGFDAAEIVSLNGSDGESILKLMPMCYSLELSDMPDMEVVDVTGMSRLAFLATRGLDADVIAESGTGDLRRCRFGSPAQILLSDCCLQIMTAENDNAIDSVSVHSSQDDSRLFRSVVYLFNDSLHRMFN